MNLPSLWWPLQRLGWQRYAPQIPRVHHHPNIKAIAFETGNSQPLSAKRDYTSKAYFVSNAKNGWFWRTTNKVTCNVRRRQFVRRWKRAQNGGWVYCKLQRQVIHAEKYLLICQFWYIIRPMSKNDKPLIWLHSEIKTPPFSLQARLKAGFDYGNCSKGAPLTFRTQDQCPSLELDAMN